MNDSLIRKYFHAKKLWRHHANEDTLVLDELGLLHGKSRADIAVINGHLAGFEIKSNDDSLARLDEQVEAYSAVFDRATVVVGTRHATAVQGMIPHWWGLTVCTQGQRGAVHFETVRKTETNKNVDPVSVARLLWHNEAADILSQKNVSPRLLRRPRAVLYESLADMLDINELRKMVRTCLKNRKTWRCPA